MAKLSKRPMPQASISRRNFIRVAAGAVAIATTIAAAGSKRAPFKLRYVLSTRGAPLEPTSSAVSAHLNQARDYIERVLASV
jgi:hypothetical protein